MVRKMVLMEYPVTATSTSRGTRFVSVLSETVTFEDVRPGTIGVVPAAVFPYSTMFRTAVVFVAALEVS
jgi:hypothetical protein